MVVIYCYPESEKDKVSKFYLTNFFYWEINVTPNRHRTLNIRN